MSGLMDLTAHQFGKLFVLAEAPKQRRRRRWLCVCECGWETIVDQSSLQRGKSRSCGCGIAQAALKHGSSRTPEYRVWASMITRCHTASSQSYCRYGARGITVCERWRKSFDNFIADVGLRQTPLHSLDRIDNDKGYSADNVRWATSKTQTRNRSNNKFASFEGEVLCIKEIAERTGISASCFYNKLQRDRCDPQEAVDWVLGRML